MQLKVPEDTYSWGFREVQGVKAKLLRVGSDSWALPSGDGAIAEFSSSLYSHVVQLFFPFSFFSQCDSPGAPFEAMKRPHSEQQLQAEL